MIRTELMPHQVQISDFAAKRRFAGIFSEYGTGKTLCALDIISRLKLTRVLVVSTKTSVQGTWPSEIRKHSNFGWIPLLGTPRQKQKMLYYGLSSIKKYHGVGSMLFLVNYDGVRNIYNDLIQVPWDVIFLDESTKIKSPFTKRTKVLWSLGRQIPRRYIMTGFPVTENFTDLYAQIKFLYDKNILGVSYYEFVNKYFVKMGAKLVVRRNQVPEMVGKISEFCIRVTNKMLKLPPKRYKVIDVEKTKEQAKALKQLDQEFRLTFGKVKIDTQFVFALIEKSLEICDGFIQDTPPKDKKTGKPLRKPRLEVINTNKDEALIETLEELDARYNKVVIWCAFRFTVKKLYRILTRLGYNVLTLTGATEDANLVVQRFQTTRKYTILLASQKKAAESITLTACRFAIYYSNIWSGDARENSEARIRRKGSEGYPSILYLDFITKGSVEGKVYRCLREKRNLVSDLKKYFTTIGEDDDVN